jgi:ketosteroid isomerase-like protein
MHGLSRYAWLLALLVNALPQTATADEATDRLNIEAAAQAWTSAYNARNSEAMAKLATDDVVLLDPTLPPVSGRSAAQEIWMQALRRNKGSLETSSKEIRIATDFAWRIAALTHLPPNAVARPTQTLEIWQRTNDGWKLHRQMSSGILAPTRLLRSPPAGPMRDSAKD